MIITEFTIDPTFTFLTIKADTETAATFTKMYVYIGEDYLKPLPIDLSSKVSTPSTTIDTTITLAELGLTSEDTLNGIYTIYLEDNTATPVWIEGIVVNLYYINLCLANMIIDNDLANGWNDINTIYMLMLATTTYAATLKIEEALNAYTRLVAMCEQYPKYMVTTDVTPCEVGSGCWIYNGTYIIN